MWLPAVFAEVDESLYERFKAAINKRYGGIKKGDLQRAVIEAIEAWIKGG